MADVANSDHRIYSWMGWRIQSTVRAKKKEDGRGYTRRRSTNSTSPHYKAKPEICLGMMGASSPTLASPAFKVIVLVFLSFVKRGKGPCKSRRGLIYVGGKMGARGRTKIPLAVFMGINGAIGQDAITVSYSTMSLPSHTCRCDDPA